MSSRPNPRPKRPAPSNQSIPASLLNTSTSSFASKKPRFDARNPSALAPDQSQEALGDDEDDPTLAFGSVGGGNIGVKRGAINLDGFDSDSSNDGFDGRQEAKARERREAEKERNAAAQVDDMFGGDDSESEDEERSVSDHGSKVDKKSVRFLDKDEITGQELDSKAGGHVSGDFAPGIANGKGKGKAAIRNLSSDSSESSSRAISPEVQGIAPEDAEEIGAGGSKKHAPTLDAFNMRAELDEGAFDASGNYVRRAVDPTTVHDSWLQGIDRKEVKKAAAAAQKRADDERSRREKDDAVQLGDVIRAMILSLQKSETALEGLARLEKAKPKTKKVWKKKAKKPVDGQADEMEVDSAAKSSTEPQEPEDLKEKTRREAVDAITEGANALLSRGQTDVYGAERELLVRWYRRETGEEWVEPVQEEKSAEIQPSKDEIQTEYRWADGREDRQIYGPYDNVTMKAWQDAGFFKDGVEFRSVDENAKEDWSRVGDFS